MQNTILFLAVIIVILVVPTSSILAYEIYLKDRVNLFFLRWRQLTQKAIRDMNELKSWLASHKIDFSAWGSGAAKSLEDLYREVQKGDSTLQAARRIVNVAIVIIQSGENYLIESKQEFADNRSRKRHWPPSEKLQIGERPEEAAKRCLFEELGLRDDQIDSVIQKSEPIVEEKPSMSYPGLKTEYHLHVIEAKVSGLPQREFKTKEEPFSNDQLVKWHTWKWGDLPSKFQHIFA